MAYLMNYPRVASVDKETTSNTPTIKSTLSDESQFYIKDLLVLIDEFQKLGRDESKLSPVNIVKGGRIPLIDCYFSGRFSDLEYDEGASPIKPTDYKNYVVEINISGYSREDIELTLDKHQNTLIVTGNSSNVDEEDRVYIMKEMKRSSFKKEVYLPDIVDIENVNKDYNDGIIKLSFPLDKEKRYTTISL